MCKISIAIYCIFLFSLVGHTGLAQSDAAEAAAVFRVADKFLDSYDDSDDAEVTAALAVLKKMVDEGNRHLLNRKVEDARGLAQQVDAQMELVRLLSKLAKMKARLHQLQLTTQRLGEKGRLLKARHRRLVLERDGRAMTGAYPSPDENTGGDQ